MSRWPSKTPPRLIGCEIVAALRKGHRTVSQLCAQIGCTDDSVRSWLSELHKSGCVYIVAAHAVPGRRFGSGRQAYIYGWQPTLFERRDATAGFVRSASRCSTRPAAHEQCAEWCNNRPRLTPVRLRGYGVSSLDAVTVIRERVTHWWAIDYNGCRGTAVALDAGKEVVWVVVHPSDVERALMAQEP